MLPGLSGVQLQVWRLRACNTSYSDIVKRVDGIKYNYQIASCLYRTAFGLHWTPGLKRGNDPFLNPVDEAELVQFLTENCLVNDCLRTFEVIEAAESMKRWRYESAIRMLREINCEELAARVSVFELKPSRSWLNGFCLRHGLRISSVSEIQRARHRAGYFDNLAEFLFRINRIVAGTPPDLVFNCDETMLSGKRRYKGVTVEGVQAVAPVDETPQHMSSLVTICATGVRVPQLIVLSGLLNLPPSLDRFTSRCWFASSSNGWVTRKIFLLWAVNFCHWLSTYRLTLPCNLRNCPAVLYLDGHSSRQNPAAIAYLRQHNVIVIALPAHVTHIMQPFDVGIASPYKAEFKKRVVQLQTKITGPNQTDILRTASVWAAVEAYERAATFSTTQISFQKAGLLPVSVAPLRQSPYVIPGRRDEQPTAYQVSGRVLTDPNEFALMHQVTLQRCDPNDLILSQVNPYRVSNELKGASLTTGRLLSPICPAVIRRPNGLIIEVGFS